MPLQSGLTIERICQLARVSRAGFYRWLQEPQSVEAEMEVRSAIQQIAMEHRRRYGYRRISAELENQRQVNKLGFQPYEESIRRRGCKRRPCPAAKAVVIVSGRWQAETGRPFLAVHRGEDERSQVEGIRER